MFSTLFKKKISEFDVARFFINNTIKAVDNSFDTVCKIIESDSVFVERPDLKPQGSDKMLILVLAANIETLSNNFESYQDRRMANHSYSILAEVFGMPTKDVQQLIASTQGYLKHINKPSKNPLYGLSKGIFHKYNLNEYQEDYFKNMKTPNPILLKHLDELMAQFLWDWHEIKDKYNIVDR